MDQRYSLRFETGERRGESIPINGSGITVGRKPGNTLQILDNSISGQHALVLVRDDGVVVKDLGSKNGTRVGTQRVLEHKLAHGDVVLFGNIKLVFQDGRGGHLPSASDGGIELEDAQDAPTRAASPEDATVSMGPAVEAQADALVRVSSDQVARSKKRSFSGLIGLAALAAVGGGLWFWLNRAGTSAVPTTKSVESVAGNLLAEGYSFEGDNDAWTSAEGSPAAFLKNSGARRSGASGIEADLAGGDWALHRSAPLRASSDREWTARAYARTHGAAEARIGIEFTEVVAEGAPRAGAIVAWSAVLTQAAEMAEMTISAAVPPGYGEGRVVLLARSRSKDAGPAEVMIDDVSLVESARAATPVASSESAGLFVHGDPPAIAHLFKIDRVLVSGLAFVPASAANAWDAAPIDVKSEGAKISIAARAQGNHALVLRAESPLAHARIATIAGDGYRTHALDFERAGVTSVLLGGGTDLVRLVFKQPASIRGQAEGGASRLEITTQGSLDSVEMQLDFKNEVKESGNIAHAANSAEEKGDLGGALREWARLLDGYPFEEALVDEAEAARARLVQKGLSDLRDVRAEVERARFFRLADLYRRCREKALGVGARYRGSEVEKEAQKVADDVAQDIALLDTDLMKAERARVNAILVALDAQSATGLASEVRTYLAEKLGEKR